ncbi:hypothetical protein NWE48_23635 [Escherichia coli]|nr:hypothetical protein [Escherichia coli]
MQWSLRLSSREPDGTVGDQCHQPDGGDRNVSASINNSSLSRDVTFVADVRTAQITDLVVIKDGSGRTV